MPLRVFKFCFSPPARLVHLTAEICNISDVVYEEVDLSRAEQLTERFLEINPKHQVPAIDEGGEYMAESRDICRYLLDKYNKDPQNEHWYPRDPEKRKRVDEWMDWSKPLHLAVELGVVVEHVACQEGMNWRPTYGFILAIVGAVSRAKGQSFTDLKKYVDEAEEIVGKQGKNRVEDLDLGDIATFMEITLPMECHPAFQWSDCPNLSKLYALLKEVPQFEKVHKPFLDFLVPFKAAVASKRGTTCWEFLTECFTGIKTVVKLAGIEARKKS